MAAGKRLRPNGLLFAAPVCSTWVFMSRGSTGRDLALAGHWKSSRSVMAANAMAARVASLCHFAASAGSHFVVEQPATTVMYSYKPCMALRSLYRSHMAVGSVLGAGRLWPYPPATLVLGPFPECVMEASSPKILGARSPKTPAPSEMHLPLCVCVCVCVRVCVCGRCIPEGADAF